MIGKASKKPNGDEGKMEDTKPEMMIFSADTQPDVEVALAVHASAALPPVFKPVKIKLANGDVGKFEDGGVLNNAPDQRQFGHRPCRGPGARDRQDDPSYSRTTPPTSCWPARPRPPAPASTTSSPGRRTRRPISARTAAWRTGRKTW